jgi:hypothetical protein
MATLRIFCPCFQLSDRPLRESWIRSEHKVTDEPPAPRNDGTRVSVLNACTNRQQGASSGEGPG